MIVYLWDRTPILSCPRRQDWNPIPQRNRARSCGFGLQSHFSVGRKTRMMRDDRLRDQGLANRALAPCAFRPGPVAVGHCSFGQQAGQSLGGQSENLAAHLDVEGAIEGLVADDGDGSARQKAEVRPTPQARRIVVLYLADHQALTDLEGMQGSKITAGQSAFSRWNGMPVRVFKRLAEVAGDRLFQPRRDGVLQRLGFRIDLA